MNPNITRFSIIKNEGCRDYGDLLFNAQGNGYNNSCSINELVCGTSFAQGIIRFVGLTPADIDWIEQKAMELYRARKYKMLDINMKTNKIRKY